jgi:hypothetical protein
MQHGLITFICITTLVAFCQYGLRSPCLDRSVLSCQPHVCPFELYKQQGLPVSTCLQRLVTAVHDRIPFMEGCKSKDSSLSIAILTLNGTENSNRGPGEVLLPPGPGPGIRPARGSSFAWTIAHPNGGRIAEILIDFYSHAEIAAAAAAMSKIVPDCFEQDICNLHFPCYGQILLIWSTPDFAHSKSVARYGIMCCSECLSNPFCDKQKLDIHKILSAVRTSAQARHPSITMASEEQGGGPPGKQQKTGHGTSMEVDAGLKEKNNAERKSLEPFFDAQGSGAKLPSPNIMGEAEAVLAEAAIREEKQRLADARAVEERRAAEPAAAAKQVKVERRLAAERKEAEAKAAAEAQEAEAKAAAEATAAANAAAVAAEAAMQKAEDEAAALGAAELAAIEDDSCLKLPDSEDECLRAGKELQKAVGGARGGSRPSVPALAKDLALLLDDAAPLAMKISYRKGLKVPLLEEGALEGVLGHKLYSAEFLNDKLPVSAQAWGVDPEQIAATTAVLSIKTPEPTGVPAIPIPLELALQDGTDVLCRSLPLFIVADGPMLLQIPNFISEILPVYLEQQSRAAAAAAAARTQSLGGVAGTQGAQAGRAMVVSPPKSMQHAGESSSGKRLRGLLGASGGERREMKDARQWTAFFLPDEPILGESYAIQIGGNGPKATKGQMQAFLATLDGLPRYVLSRVPNEDDENSEIVHPLFYMAFASDVDTVLTARIFASLGIREPNWNYVSSMQRGSNVNSRELKLPNEFVAGLGGNEAASMAIIATCGERGALGVRVGVVKNRQKENVVAFTTVWPNQGALDKCVGLLRIHDTATGRSASVRVQWQGALMLELGQLEFPASDFGAIWFLGEERIKQALESHLEPLQVEIKVYTVNDDQMVCASVVPTSAAFMLARFTPWVWIAGAFRKLKLTFGVNSAGIAGEDYNATMMRMIPGPPAHAVVSRTPNLLFGVLFLQLTRLQSCRTYDQTFLRSDHNQFFGGFANQFSGGYANQFSGGCANQFSGGYANEFSGGCANQFSGGSANQFFDGSANQFSERCNNQSF